mgnify:FL=1
MAEYSEIVLNLAKICISDRETLDKIVDSLATGTRRSRQQAAQVLGAISLTDVSAVSPYSQNLVDALNRPEAQTRWECLDILTRICDVDASLCDGAIDGAENALFDEESGTLHLSAMRFLCKFGSLAEQNSERVWPLVDEGIQCWHGDLEFQDMLNALIEFSTGKLSSSVKSEFADRMRFDSTNGRGALKRKATTIVENLS